mmetsp:Transcript_5721/g.10081  ORF Transcript_5721/g.10081 Transcript_5721/m.10081 type:complete len:221 (-) Transcript_5721:424-1086(-)
MAAESLVWNDLSQTKPMDSLKSKRLIGLSFLIPFHPLECHLQQLLFLAQSSNTKLLFETQTNLQLIHLEPEPFLGSLDSPTSHDPIHHPRHLQYDPAISSYRAILHRILHEQESHLVQQQPYIYFSSLSSSSSFRTRNQSFASYIYRSLQSCSSSILQKAHLHPLFPSDPSLQTRHLLDHLLIHSQPFHQVQTQDRHQNQIHSDQQKRHHHRIPQSCSSV